MSLLPFETVLTADHPEYTIIWLHGLGADGHDFVSLVPELKLPKSLRIKFVFPHASVRAVTVNNGMQMRAWYDLLSLDRGKTADEADILNTVIQINAMIDQEVKNGSPADKIILAGFSQGGVIALHAGLRYPQKLAGIMALSTYLPFDDNAFQQMSGVQK
ncbi:MAG: alpha/beta fold hydrolase, partial [Cocleimonas sp.]